MMSTALPAPLSFAQLVGLDTARQALLLLAVNPLLSGVIIAARAGSGKSTLARAFAALLPDSTPFVELPLNVTEDRLLGGVDLEATLVAGRPILQPGLLARAHAGVLYVDNLNLLERATAAHVAEALSAGWVRVEREGLSTIYPAQFMLVGTYDPDEGDVPPGLLDRVGLIVPLAARTEAALRAEVVRRNLRPPQDEGETELLRGMIHAARERLRQVQIAEDQIAALMQAALALGVEGNRADLFAVHAALASAALEGRDAVDEDDLRLALRLVLIPRATQRPADSPPAAQPSPRSASNALDRDEGETSSKEPETPRELLLEAAQALLPPDLLELPFAAHQRGRRGSRGATLNMRRGRFVRAVPGDPRSGHVALLPTLTAAAPWQRLRRGSESSARVHIRRNDLRLKRYRDKAGTLYIFAVDASGSMAINRMREAKGAAIRLLQDAYVHRDQVALIAFRGQGAQVLLPPSQSVERAKRELDVLPTGGGTPLASALLTAWQLARQARERGVAHVALVLMTDGRANIGVRAAPSDRQQLREEIQQLAARLRADGVSAVVVDTQANYLSRNEGQQLAQWLGGRYVYLPNARAEHIARALGKSLAM